MGTVGKDKRKASMSQNKVLIIGADAAGDILVEEILKMGLGVIRVCDSPLSGVAEALTNRGKGSKADQELEIFSPAQLMDLEGYPGQFRAAVRAKGRSFHLEVGAVVLATGCCSKEPFSSWGLAEASGTVSLLEFVRIMNSGGPAAQGGLIPSCTALICGFGRPTYPSTQEMAVEAAVSMCSAGAKKVFFVTDHLKVASKGMERLLGKARDAGVIFIRSSNRQPIIEQSGEGISALFYDDALGRTVSLSPDLLVVEDLFMPWEGTGSLADMLRIDLDEAGFFQGENIHYLPIFTNRTGILAIGSTKGPVPYGQAAEEAKAAALEIGRLLLGGGIEAAQDRLELDKKKCALCLTCYRLCPHRAISYIDRRPVFHGIACSGCGICAAECPMDAIQINGNGDRHIKEKIEILHGMDEDDKKDSPSIFIFACRRSAVAAADSSSASGYHLPARIKTIEVPCAGRIDPDYLFSAFRKGADGVMVLACHHGSCKSIDGSRMAEARSVLTGEALREMGIAEERIFFGTLAPAECEGFSRMVDGFERRLRKLSSPETGSEGS